MVQVLILGTAFLGATTLAAAVFLWWNGKSSHQLEDRLVVLAGSSSGPIGRKGSGAASLLAEPLLDRNNPLEDFVARFCNLRLLLEQADLRWSPAQLLCAMGACAGGSLLLGMVLPIPRAGLPGLALAAAFIPLAAVLLKRRRRLAQFGKQLPEALELISRALRAGHSLGAGISLVADEMADPIRREFNRCYEEQNLGVPLEEALDAMTNRVPNLDLRFFATAVILQRQTGGDLAEILDKIGHLIRERFKIWGQIQALTGEGRLSGVVLLALPPVLFAVMYKMNPEYMLTLFTDPLGTRMLAGAIVMQLLGALVIKKIVNIKV